MSPLGKIQWKFFAQLFNIQNLLISNLGYKVSKKYEKRVIRVKNAAELLSSATAQNTKQ